MTQRDVAVQVQARVATMGRGSTDELLHVQIADDRRVGECPRGVRVRGKGAGALDRKKRVEDKDEDKDEPTVPMSNRFNTETKMNLPYPCRIVSTEPSA